MKQPPQNRIWPSGAGIRTGRFDVPHRYPNNAVTNYVNPAVHHGDNVAVEVNESLIPLMGFPGDDTPMLDVPPWVLPTIPRGIGPLGPYDGHGPMVPYVPEDPMGSDYNIRPDDVNPRPHKQVYGEEGRRWGIGPNLVAWHGYTPTQMDYIFDEDYYRLD